MKNFVKDLTVINDRINALVADRSKLISDSSEKILTHVYKMMDWDKEDVATYRIEWNDFEGGVCIEVCIRKDSCARYVFKIEGGKLFLKFREDFAKCHQ